MIRHTLATQRHTFSEPIASSAPSPPARERVPASFESRIRTTSLSTSSPSSTSTIVANGHSFSSGTASGSDTNLSRMYSSHGSMRRQLLRRLWHKEYRRLDRTGSLSPPLQRSLRSKRAFRALDNVSPEVCLECQKLEETQFNRSVPEITMKRIRHNNSFTAQITTTTTSATTSASSSAVAFPRKSYSIETETINGLMLGSAGNKVQTTIELQSTANTVTSSEMEIVDAVKMLHQMNGNFASSTEDDIGSGKDNVQTDGNSFLIEIGDDQINITTTATTQSTIHSDTTADDTTSESSCVRQQKQLKSQQSINSRPSTAHSQQHAQSTNDSNNNNESGMDNTNNNNASHHTSNDNYIAQTNQIINDNNNKEPPTNPTIFSLNDTLDQNTIDTIISQILVDSLNNIIVVQGKVNQNASTTTDSENNIVLNSSQTQTDGNFDENASNDSLPLPVTDQIYFPHYLSTETLTEYSTKLSSDSNANLAELLPANLVISVISGSSYPSIDGGEMIVHRFADMPRTESMEVQPSSAPSVDGKDTQMNQVSDNEEENDDDTVSLVDSLDDPYEDVNANVIVSKAVVEKSQAFFVPMEHNVTKDENIIQSTDDSNQTASNLDTAIANSMPDRLRERLERRQAEISDRKEAEMKQRQEKIQKLISDHESNAKTATQPKFVNSSSFEILSDPNKSPTQAVKKSQTRIKPHPTRKTSKKQLNNEIGLLESYTVDGQGNLQFTESNSKSNGKKITTVSGPVVKHVIKKTTTTTTKPVTRKTVREKHATIEKSAVVGKKSKILSSNSSKQVSVSKKRTDVQKMTLVHHSPAEMITPDRDCGPRRMYQKTEIREGAKRIEILEIVECLNSSDSIQPSSSPQSFTSSQSLIEKYTAKQSSKIPVAVPVKSKNRNKAVLSNSQQRSLKAQIRDSVKHSSNSKSDSNSVSSGSANNSKVDQIIADLLIEALNHSTDIGIEFIKTPQNMSAQSLLKLNNVTKRVNLSTRRSNGIVLNANGGKRSAHSSAKYQQLFDAIPEEKSSSLSMDSPNEDTSASSVVETSSIGRGSETKSTASKGVYSTAETKKLGETTTDTSGKLTHSNDKAVKKMASGKAAIESDQDRSEAWFGCFGRTHVDSPVDAMLSDEGIFKVLHKSSVAV